MMRLAIIMAGEVQNVAVWDGIAHWLPADGQLVVQLADDEPCAPGWIDLGYGESPRFVEPPEEPS